MSQKIKKIDKANLDEFMDCFQYKLKIKLKESSSNKQFEAILHKYSIDSFIIRFCDPIDHADLIPLIGKTLLGTVLHHDKILGVSFSIALINDKFAICELPLLDIYSLDVRNKERLHINPSLFSTIRVLFTIDEKLNPYIFNVYDISTDGFSILVPMEHMNVIKLNKQYSPVNIRLSGTQITLIAECRNVFQLASKPNFFKIGFQIIKIQTSHKSIIEEYIEKHKKILKNNEGSQI